MLTLKVDMHKGNQNKNESKRSLLKRVLTDTVLTMATLAVVAAPVLAPRVFADKFDDQIKQLQQQNADNQNTVSQLEQQAASYQDAISRLQSQINGLQQQITSNVAKQNDLQAKIEQSQRDLDQQRQILGDNIRVMYLEGDVSMTEMLASSKNLSDFVDKEEYHTAIGNKIQATLKKIADLQNQMQAQKTEVEGLIADQKVQQGQLASNQTQQTNLLGYNQTQQADFNQKTQNNEAQIASLMEEQRKANSVLPAVGYYFLRFPGAVEPHNASDNDYPYASAGFGMSTAPGCVDNDGPDKWGYCTRQCVSYAAWAVERSGRTAPSYYGNAKDWVTAAPRSIVYTEPKVGDVAISTAGAWGHAMYVEQVDGSRILVSQYNQQLNGQYSIQWRNYR